MELEKKEPHALPPMATLRYLQWYYLNHMVYGACALIAVCAMFQVIFFGMKFDSEHIHGTPCHARRESIGSISIVHGMCSSARSHRLKTRTV